METDRYYAGGAATSGARGEEVRLESAANDVLVSVAGPRVAADSPDAPAGVETQGAGRTGTLWELASVTFPSGEVFGYSMVGARPVSPKVDGSISLYEDVMPGVDVELEATATGLKETIVLASPEAGASWVFPLRLDGLSASLDKDGSLLLAGVEGEVVARIPPGRMWDSRFEPRSGEFTRSSAVRYELVEDGGGGPALSLNPRMVGRVRAC